MDSYEDKGQSCQEMSSKIVEVEVNEKDTCKDNWDFIILMKEYLSNVLGSDLQGRVVVHTTRVENKVSSSEADDQDIINI